MKRFKKEQIDRIRFGILNGLDFVELAKNEGIKKQKDIRYLRGYLIRKFSLEIERVDKKKTWTKEEVEELRKYLDEGKSYEEITNLFESRHSIQSIIGIVRKSSNLRYQGDKRRIISREEEMEIIEKLRSKKYTSRMIEQEYKISTKQVSNIAKKNKMTIPSDIEVGVVYSNTGKVIYNITKERLENLILETKKSLKQISVELNISLGTLKRRLKAFGIKRQVPAKTNTISYKKQKIIFLTNLLFSRDPTEIELRSPIKKILTKDILECLYNKYERNTIKLCKYLQLSKSIVDNLIREYGIERNHIVTFFDYPLDYYRDLLFKKKLSFSEIAKLVGLNEETVRKHITKLIPESKQRLGFSSRGELYTDKALRELNLDYIYNKCYYLDILNSNKKFFIDFEVNYNNKTYWIEYNGKQHYCFIPYFFSESKQEWIDQLKRDKTVRDYSTKNNIFLLEIPYTYDGSNKIRNLIKSIILDENTIDTEKFKELLSEEAIEIYNNL